MWHAFYNGKARDVALRRVRRNPTPGNEEKTACCPLLRINETPWSKQHAPHNHLTMHKKRPMDCGCLGNATEIAFFNLFLTC